MSTITVPPGAVTRVMLVSPMAYVMVAPAGVEADLSALTRPGVVGLFTFDPGITWPTRQGCGLASAYLERGHPILFQYERLADALAAQERLVRDARG